MVPITENSSNRKDRECPAPPAGEPSKVNNQGHKEAVCGLRSWDQRSGSGVHAVSKSYTNPVAYDSAVSEVRNQLEFGTEMQAMVAASDELRELDPEHPLVVALEVRIRRASKVNFMALRSKLAASTRCLD